MRALAFQPAPRTVGGAHTAWTLPGGRGCRPRHHGTNHIHRGDTLEHRLWLLAGVERLGTWKIWMRTCTGKRRYDKAPRAVQDDREMGAPFNVVITGGTKGAALCRAPASSYLSTRVRKLIA